MTNSTNIQPFPPRWRELAACAQFTILTPVPLVSQFKIQNSKFKILTPTTTAAKIIFF